MTLLSPDALVMRAVACCPPWVDGHSLRRFASRPSFPRSWACCSSSSQRRFVTICAIKTYRPYSMVSSLTTQTEIRLLLILLSHTRVSSRRVSLSQVSDWLGHSHWADSVTERVTQAEQVSKQHPRSQQAHSTHWRVKLTDRLVNNTTTTTSYLVKFTK